MYPFSVLTESHARAEQPIQAAARLIFYFFRVAGVTVRNPDCRVGLTRIPVVIYVSLLWFSESHARAEQPIQAAARLQQARRGELGGAVPDCVSYTIVLSALARRCAHTYIMYLNLSIHLYLCTLFIGELGGAVPDCVSYTIVLSALARRCAHTYIMYLNLSTYLYLCTLYIGELGGAVPDCVSYTIVLSALARRYAVCYVYITDTPIYTPINIVYLNLSIDLYLYLYTL